MDPRYKGQISVDYEYLKSTILKIAEKCEEELVPPTQGQELDNITNPVFTATPSSADNTHNLTVEELVNRGLFVADGIADDLNDSTPLAEKIASEIRLYKSLKFTEDDKLKINVLKWWKENSKHFPFLGQAAKALLHTPATSVPSERIFSEAGYIARARRSRFIPANLNKNLFVKKNMKYIRTGVGDLTMENAQAALDAADDLLPNDFPNNN